MNQNKKQIKVVVVIPTFNNSDTLGDCVKSVLEQNLKPFKIIIVNNGGEDISMGEMKIQNPKSKIQIIRHKYNLGVAGGRNRGIKEAGENYDYIFFFDHDMVADRDMLRKLVKVAESDKKIGIVTPKIYYWEEKDRIWSAGTGMNLWTGQVLFRGGLDRGQYEKTEEVQVAPAAMLIKKVVIDNVKGFEEKYFATYEDTDFCFRAKRAGYKIFYAPKAIAFHKLSTNSKEEADRLLSRAYWVGRNRIIFMKIFGRNMLIFVTFLPIYTIYYLKLALQRRRLSDWFLFLKGTVDGLLTS